MLNKLLYVNPFKYTQINAANETLHLTVLYRLKKKGAF